MQRLLRQFHNSWSDLLNIHLPTLCNGLKSRNILTTNNHKAPLVWIDTTLVFDEVTHGLQGFTVGGENRNQLVFVEGACYTWKLCECGHEDRLCRVTTCQCLKVHHEATVSCDACHTLGNQPVNPINKVLLDLRSHSATLADLK